MQITTEVPTIELDLLKAIAASGAVSQDNAMDPIKNSFMRCARTDKGVHAAGQVVSLKMIIEDDDIIDRINACLPDQIRVWGFARVANGFHAKNHCDARIYEYLMPTYILNDVDPNIYPRSAVGIQKSGKVPEGHTFGDQFLLEPSTHDQMQTKYAYRIDTQRLDAFRLALAGFVGTHNFHNFTIRKKFTEKSANRYIMSFDCSEPFLRRGSEWLSIKIKGQSFMLHQIRKMVGLAVMMVRTGTPTSLLEKAFTATRINVPKAPALGLLLEKPIFSAYNKQMKEKSTVGTPITFEPYQDKIDQFKSEWIYEAQVDEEFKTSHFDQWINLVDRNADDYAWYLLPDGTIDESTKPEYTRPEISKPSGDDDEDEAGDDE
eukprot:jgi/Hompol1/6439/HPOL_003534-RA